MSEDRVQIDVSDGVADVRLVRADKHNALDWPMFLALDAATDELARTRRRASVVLSGDGPSFCSGLDFPSFMAGDVGVDEMIADVPGEVANIAQRVAYDWQRLPMPVIAAIHGNCLGGGAQIALGADIRISAPDLQALRHGDQVRPDPGHGHQPGAAGARPARRRQGDRLHRPRRSAPTRRSSWAW